MKFKICSAVLFFSLTVTIDPAQDFATVKSSNLAEVKLKFPAYASLVGKKDNMIYSMVRAGNYSVNEYHMQAFNMQSSSLDFSVKPEDKFEEKNIIYHQLVWLNGKPLNIGISRKMSAKKMVILGEWINEKGTVTGKPQIIDERNDDEFYDRKSFFKTTDDGQKLIYVQYNKKQSLPNEVVRMSVFDENLKKITEADFGSIFPGRELKYRDCCYDDNGNLNLLLKCSKKSAEQKTGQDAEGFRILRFDPKENKIKGGIIEIPERKLSQISFSIGKDGNAVVLGFTSNYQGDNIGGVFTQVWDFKNDKPFFSKETKLPASLMAKVNKNQKGDNDTELDNFGVGNIVTLDNGNIVVSVQHGRVEDYMEQSTIMGDPKQFEKSSGDVIVFCVVPGTAELKWIAHIPLKFSSLNSFYGSRHCIFAAKNTAYVFFNDCKEAGKNGGGKDNVSYVGKIDDNGNILRKEIISHEKKECIIEPGCWLKTAPNECVVRLLSRDGKQTGFSVITFK